MTSRDQAHSPESINWKKILRGPLALIGVLWVVHLFQALTGVELGMFGVYPRNISGLRGILLSPLIHADFRHLLSNTVPLFLLTVTLLAFYPRVGWRAFWLIYLLTGMAVWLFARPVYHIGASGVVYGLVAFIFWTGIFRRSIKTIVLTLVVTLLYSGYIVGILPNQEGISWESHLLGGLVGIFVAWWFRDVTDEDEGEEEFPEREPHDEPRYFLPRDTFDRPRMGQRNSGWHSDHT